MILAAALVPSFFSPSSSPLVAGRVNEDIRLEGSHPSRSPEECGGLPGARRGAQEAGLDDDVATGSAGLGARTSISTRKQPPGHQRAGALCLGPPSTRLDSGLREPLSRGWISHPGSRSAWALSSTRPSRPHHPGLRSTRESSPSPCGNKAGDPPEAGRRGGAILIVTGGNAPPPHHVSLIPWPPCSEPGCGARQAARRIEARTMRPRSGSRPGMSRPFSSIPSTGWLLPAASARGFEERSDYIEKILLNATTGWSSLDPRAPGHHQSAARVLAGPPPRGAGTRGIGRASREVRRPLASPERPGASGGEGEKTWQLPLAGQGTASGLRVVSLPSGRPEDSPGEDSASWRISPRRSRSSRLEAWPRWRVGLPTRSRIPSPPIQPLGRPSQEGLPLRDSRFREILEECLDAIQKQVENLRSIAGEFSEYARVPSLRPERVAVADLLEEVLQPYRIPLRGDPPGIVGEPRNPRSPGGYRSLTGRALVNLVPECPGGDDPAGGLSWRVRRPGPPWAGGSPPRVLILVSDSGRGMDPRTLARLFEPYFSHQGGGGRDLDSPSVRKTVEQQGGRARGKVLARFRHDHHLWNCRPPGREGSGRPAGVAAV